MPSVPLTIPLYASEEWHKRFIDLAAHVAGWSKDPSTKTGAVIVDPNKHVVSLGFNGFPQEMQDKEEWLENRDEKYSRVVHCEMNALIFARNLPQYCTLYTWPFMSCDRCVVHMIQAGIWRFVAPKPSPDKEARWGEAFNRARGYIKECDCELIEI